jgi:hypothetical protein
MFKFKGMRDIDARLGVNVLGSPHRSIALFLSLSSYAVHPRIPPGSDTVATSGLPVLPLCFTRVRWTARVLRSRTNHCTEFAREAMTSILGSSSVKGLKNSSFHIFVIDGNVRIGVKRRELND